MNPIFVRKAIAIVSVLFGAGWCWAMIYLPLRHFLASEREASDYLFILTIMPLMVIPGVLAGGAGIKLYRAMNEGALKCALGTFAFLGALAISRALTFIFPHRLAEETERQLFLLLGTLVVISLYLIAVRKLLGMLGQGKPKLTELLGRGALTLIAWEVWLLLNAVFREYSPLEEGQKYLHKEPWQTLGLLIPIIVAYGGYKLAARLLPAKIKPSAKWQSLHADSPS